MTLILQVVIAVIVVYLIFSVMVSTITEWLTTLIQLRGKRLKDAILKLFNNKELEKGIRETEKKYQLLIDGSIHQEFHCSSKRKIPKISGLAMCRD